MARDLALVVSKCEFKQNKIDVAGENAEQEAGIEIIKCACESPFRAIMENAGLKVTNYAYDVYLPKNPGNSLIEIVTPKRVVLNQKDIHAQFRF